MARPPLPLEKRLSVRATTWLTPHDHRRLERKARARGVPVGVLVREMVLRALAHPSAR